MYHFIFKMQRQVTAILLSLAATTYATGAIAQINLPSGDNLKSSSDSVNVGTSVQQTLQSQKTSTESTNTVSDKASSFKEKASSLKDKASSTQSQTTSGNVSNAVKEKASSTATEKVNSVKQKAFAQ